MIPKISIITAVFNNKKQIIQAIQSVLNQNYSNIEYIVIDGGSTDGTIKAIQGFGDRIQKFHTGHDNGIYDALNKGISLATGEIVGFLHSDDQFAHTSVLSNIAKAFQESGASGIYSDLEYVNAEKTIRYWKSCTFNQNLLNQGWMPPHPTLYLKRSIYDELGNFSLQYKISADYDFILRLFNSSKYKFHYLPEVTIKMHTGGVSNRNLKKILEKSKEDYLIIRRHGHSGFSTLFQKNFNKIGQFFFRANK